MTSGPDAEHEMAPDLIAGLPGERDLQQVRYGASFEQPQGVVHKMFAHLLGQGTGQPGCERDREAHLGPFDEISGNISVEYLS